MVGDEGTTLGRGGSVGGGPGDGAWSHSIAAIENSTQPLVPYSGTGHIPPFSTSTGNWFSCKKFSTASAVRIFCGRVTVGILERLSWNRTHHVFNELKIVIMGNGYGAIGAFLLDPTE
jgi:hypothetical protein